MQIKEFIRENVLHQRLKQRGCLVVYDPERRYRELCLELGDDKIQIIDASESSLESRFSALGALRQMGRPNSLIQGMLVYVPAPKPITDEQKQADPFAVYASCGAVFPSNDGDEYLSLCLRAKPDHATEIRRLFSETQSPSFAVIDAIGGGQNWPVLRTTLNAESARDILIALLTATDQHAKALKSQEGWLQEARALLSSALGMEVKTRAKGLNALADELWRFLLFSEFVFDLPEALPTALTSAPRAPKEAQPIVNDTCDRLRNDLRYRAAYLQRAESIEQELNLPEICRNIEDLGEKDTFPFEERTFLRRAIDGLLQDDTDRTRLMLGRNEHSVWRGKGESQEQWALVRAALELTLACADYDRMLPDHSRTQGDLLDFYSGHLREADRLQREFEQAVSESSDPLGMMGEVVERTRSGYRSLVQKVQTLFVKHLETAGWPPAGRLANSEVYDRFVGERLKDRGRRIAFLMVDALRYELGVALEKLIAEDGIVELHTAYAQLPTITPVGMASLLPGAKEHLTLELVGDVLLPKLDGAAVANVPQRMDCFRKRLGDRFAEMRLADLIPKKVKLASTVELLVLRSTEIDSQLENNPESTLGLIPNTLRQIRVALHRLRELGFHEAVIASDHGFFLNAQAEAGDVCAKPQGNWQINAHDRILLGAGVSDSHNCVIAADRLGIRGSFAQCALPRSMAPYRAGHLYFHGGASLAEAVVPVLVVKLGTAEKASKEKFKIEISYKSGAKKITTRLPVVEIELAREGLFAEGVEVLLEAHDENGNVVGEPRSGGQVNPATGTIMLIPGERLQVVMKMEPEFNGKFTIRALNPTSLVAYHSLTLETDYTV